jgi:16S rRNA (adenine1518-N6/adenine1519-N6)-dimethyltransferase
VLELPIAEIVHEPRATVVANLPYNITTPVLFRLLELRHRFPRAVVMIQHEVAQRLAAKPGGKAWGVLPVLIQTWADVRIAFRVSRRAFVPPPRVESAVVDVRWRAVPRVDVGDGASYRAVVRAAFGQRRKTLRNALADLGAARGLDAAAKLVAFERAGIDPGLRAERLSIEDFARLARALAPRSE